MQNDSFKRGFRHVLITGETYMSQTQSQTQPQTPKSFLNAPVYEKHELEEMLRVLSERVKHLAELLEKAERSIREIHYTLYYKTNVDIGIVDEIAEIGHRLKSRVYDAIDEMIIESLKLDVDIGKYKRAYGVEFPYESERQLGVALVREGGEVRPVVVWTNYSEVDYYEGERNE